MNSLENLNNWSNDGIAYGGDGPYAISFDPSSPTNQTTSMNEDQPFTAPVGTNITEMTSTPRNLEYTIDLSSASYEATVDWGTLPYYVTAEIVGTNIFRIVGTIDTIAWDIIKSPTITIPDQDANFTYTSTITYPDPADTDNDATKSWTTTVTVTATQDLSTPSDWVYTKNSPGTIDGTPEILNTASGTYSIVITPSETSYVYLMSSSGSGGTSTFNAIDKTLTISGTKAQVNSHLLGIVLTTSTNIALPFALNYSLTNPSGAISVQNQNLTSTEPYSIGIGTYVEDTPFSLGYEILDESATATSFSISVAQTTPLPSVSPGYFTVNGSNVGNTWTASNTRANINAANVVYTPPIDYTGTITLTVNQSKVDNGNTVVQVTNDPNNITNAGTNTEIQNMINRSYTGNTINSIFATTTPAITDGPDIGQTYTITLSSTLGKFGNSSANALAASSTYTFTGNKTACNAEFTAMKFLPNPNTSSTGTFSYTQSRGGVPQVNQTLTLTGSAGAAITPKNLVFTSNGTYTPTIEEVAFGTWNVLSLGGGGGGAALTSTNGGGGAGGQVAYSSITASTGVPNVLSSLSVTIGGGGAGSSGSTGVVTGATGGNSYVTWNGTTFFTAAGGAGGTANSGSPGSSNGGSLTAAAGGTSHTGGSGDGPGSGGITGGGGGAGSGYQPGTGGSTGVGNGFDADVGIVSNGGNGGSPSNTTSFSPGGWTYASLGGGGGGGGNDSAYGIGGGSTRASPSNGGNGGYSAAPTGTSAFANKGGGGGGGKGGAGNGAAGRIEIKIR